MANDPYAGLGTPAEQDPYAGLGEPVDPYQGLGKPAPTQGAIKDATKRVGRSLVDQPGALVQSLGEMLDAVLKPGRVAAAANSAWAGNPNAEQTVQDALTKPAPGTDAIRDTGRQMRKDAGELYTGDFAPDSARDENLLAKVADSAGPLAASIAAPGAVVAKTVTGALLNSQAAADQAEQILIQRGATEEQARSEAARQFVLNLPAGALESVGWSKLLGRYGKAIETAVEERFGKSALARILKATGEQAVIEAGEEVLQQGTQNVAAKATFDPSRKVTEGMKDAATVGAVMGGGMAATLQTAAEGAARLDRTDDTGKNKPEAERDLKAQQDQLLKGDRAVQMFPAGTPELELPAGLRRVETPRGVFHFDPRRMTADEILSASRDGKENELLGLGPYDKTEIARRMKAGEPAANVVERGPNGEELRAAVTTPSAEAETRAAIEAGKSEGSTVQIEQMEETLRRRGGLDDMLGEADAEAKKRQEAADAERAERETRQQDARAKREQFSQHLERAREIARRAASDTPPTFAEVQGNIAVLKDYAEDNRLGLTLPQRQEAQALHRSLEPLFERLKAENDTAAEQRVAEARTQAEAEKAASTERIRQDKRAVAAQADLDPVTGKRRLDSMTDEELAGEAEAGNSAALRILETRAAGPAENDAETLRNALRQVKLPFTDAALGQELKMLREEMKPIDQTQFISKRGTSLDATAQSLRERGFSFIKTPADVIDYAQRAMRGEIIRADRNGGEAQFSRATAAPDGLPARPIMPKGGAIDQVGVFVRQVGEWKKQVEAWSASVPDVLPFSTADGATLLVSRNVNGGQPWRLTWFEGQKPTGHQEYPSKADAVRAAALNAQFAPEVSFSREQLAAAGAPPNGWGKVEPEPEPIVSTDQATEATLGDFEQRLRRIAPGFMMDYRVLVGDPDILLSLGVAKSRLTGREQAAHLGRRKVLWFLQKNVRADKDGLMPDRLRRDVLHETAHGWLDSLDADEQADLKTRWEADKADPNGWLANARKGKVLLRAGVEKDWAEYWAERLAEENDRWARGREGLVGKERTFVRQLAAEFRQWLQEALQYLAQAFTRTKRYNVDFKAFINDERYAAPAISQPAGRPVATPLTAASGEEAPSFASEDQSPEERKAAMLRELNDLNGRIAALEKANISQPAIRSLLGERSELRSQLDSEAAGWRKENPKLAAGEVDDQFAATGADPLDEEGKLLAQIRRAEEWYRDDEAKKLKAELAELRQRTRPQSMPDESGKADIELSPFPATPEPLIERKGIYDEVEGHTQVRDSWPAKTWEKIKDSLGGLRGSIPELPAFADDQTQRYQRLRQFGKLIKRGTPRVWKEASDQVGEIVQPLLTAGKVDAESYERLGQLQARVRGLKNDGKTVPEALTQEIGALGRKIEREPYGLFQKIALYLDLKWRVENLKDAQGNPITQPAHINRAEIAKRIDALKSTLEASPHRAIVLAALRKHQALAKSVADDLRERDLRMPEDHQNPFYFPHVVLENAKDALERVKLDTANDFRGYLMQPVGSAKAIETDYAKAMYYHLVAVGSHNLRSDLVRDYVKPYDIMEKVRARAKELAKKYGRPVDWREAFHTDFAKDGYSLYHPDDRLPLHPEMQISRDRLAERLGIILTDGPLREQLDALGIKGVKILPEDITEAMAAGERETWVLPEKVSEALNGMLSREGQTHDSIISKPIQAFQGLWKKSILFAPWNYPRYEFNNTGADLEKLFSADPQVFKLIPAAAREVRQFIEEGKGSRDVREAFKLGVLDSITAAEVNDLSALRQFEALKTTGDNVRDLLKRISTLGLAGKRSTVDVSKLREATFRFAKFKADMDRLRNGARPVYAGAYWRDIDAIEDSRKGANDANYHKAAEISLATFGDYNNISVAGQQLRRYLIPFYSWMEINLRYHANLFRNYKDMVAAGEIAAADGAKATGRAAAVMAGTFTRKAAAGFVLRLALPYLAVALWNNSGDREEIEDELSAEDRRRFHINLGRDGNGKPMVVYAQTAFADIAKWFSGPRAAQQAIDIAAGRATVESAFADWMAQFPRDFANNLFQVGPALKIAYTAMAKKSTFPDVTDQRTIPAYDLKWAILGQATDQVVADMIRRSVDKDYLAPRDLKDWAMQAILQVRKRDPEQYAFYEIKDKAAAFLESKTGQSSDNNYNAPDQQVLRNFRKSIYKGDVENAMRFYDRLLELGYTAERFQSSIRAQEPLSALPKDMRADFVASLSPFEYGQLQRAFGFYARIAEARGSESGLFPSARLPQSRRDSYQPRHDRLRQEMENVQRLSPEELAAEGEKELRRSLRPVAR